MRACCVAIVVCVLSVLAVGQCEKKVKTVRETWVNDWNAKPPNLTGVMSLYAEDATLLPANGSRISGKDKIEAYFKTQLGSTVTPGESPKVDCSNDLAYDSGTHKEDTPGVMIGGKAEIGGKSMIGGGKHSEGSYLVVLKYEGGKWLIVQHAYTVKPN